MMSLEVHSAPELQIQELSGIIRAFLDNGGLIGLGCNTFSLPKSRETKDETASHGPVRRSFNRSDFTN